MHMLNMDNNDIHVLHLDFARVTASYEDKSSIGSSQRCMSEYV